MGLTRPTAAQIDSTTEVITDPISMLNNKSNRANVDVGFLFNRDGGISSNVAVFWQESNQRFVFALTSSNAVSRFSNIVVTSNANVQTGNVFTIGYINATGNVLATGLSIFGNVALGSLTTPGALNTLAGNVSIYGASSMLNVIGNIVVNNTAIASSNVTGAIRTTGGIGVGGNLYVGQRVGYVWGANNVSSVYQVFNNTTNSLDTVFG